MEPGVLQTGHGYNQIRRLVLHHFNQFEHRLIEGTALRYQFDHVTSVTAE